MSREAFRLSTPADDRFFNDPTLREFWRLHCPLVTGYAPGFDAVAGWHPGALAYFDAYAIYDAALEAKVTRGSTVLRLYSDTDADLMLKDALGNPVKINYRDADGQYRQYAADITNPAFVQKAIALMKAMVTPPPLANPYRGLYLDDVNLAPTFVDLQGNPSTPVDVPLWRETMIDYLRVIRLALPGMMIVHNPVWWQTDPRQIAQADYQNIERGFGDPNFHPVDYIKLAQFVAAVHSQGRHVIVEEYFAANLPNSLLCYDAVRLPGDLLAVEDMRPDQWSI